MTKKIRECDKNFERLHSARKRALEVEKKKKAKARAQAEKELEKMAFLESDETKTKAQHDKEQEERDRGISLESSEILSKYKVSDMKIMDSYAPMYEFEE